MLTFLFLITKAEGELKKGLECCFFLFSPKRMLVEKWGKLAETG